MGFVEPHWPQTLKDLEHGGLCPDSHPTSDDAPGTFARGFAKLILRTADAGVLRVDEAIEGLLPFKGLFKASFQGAEGSYKDFGGALHDFLWHRERRYTGDKYLIRDLTVFKARVRRLALWENCDGLVSNPRFSLERISLKVY